MRAIFFAGLATIFVSALLLANPASAQGWKEFSFEDGGFAAQYPSQPEVQEVVYETAMVPAGSVKERVYSVNSGGVIYQVRVADFGVRADTEDAIDEAADAMIAQGEKTHDVTARIRKPGSARHFGREIRVVDAGGTSHTNAIFFIDNKLYQIKVVYPQVNTDPNGSSGIHFFQQAFRLLP